MPMVWIQSAAVEKELLMRVQDSVAFVTGANRGLGSAFARALLAGGARKVYAAARDPDSVTLPGVSPIRLDVTNAEEIAAAVLEARDVDLLINNAGIARGAAFLGVDSVAAARAEMETNYFGPLLVSRAFAPILAANGGGVILNVLSVLSWLSFPRSATYGASKAAAWSLTNGLRNELAAQGTQVAGLHVGYMDTEMAADIAAPKSRPEDIVRLALAALETGAEEILADDISRSVKKGLSNDKGVYIGLPGR
jgi:NAD(P)-dependent dehydrogenase (short-subunit alcohol dehydrogenase family)